MSKIEKKIIDILREDSRISKKQIAKMLTVSEKEVKNALNELEKSKTIVKYSLVVNEEKLSQSNQLVKALIEVRVRPEKKSGFIGIAKRISKYPNVIDHFLISGNYDFLVVVKGKNMNEVSTFVSSKLAPIDNVISTSTHFIMKKYKENGVLIDLEEQAERLAVTL